MGVWDNKEKNKAFYVEMIPPWESAMSMAWCLERLGGRKLRDLRGDNSQSCETNNGRASRGDGVKNDGALVMVAKPTNILGQQKLAFKGSIHGNT
jgi:hypothetical protein